MMTVPIDRVKLQPFGDDGAFYSVALKRGEKSLERFMKEGTLCDYLSLDYHFIVCKYLYLDVGVPLS